MKFHTASDTARPIRLSKEIRRWADESMHGKYGTEAKQTPYVEMTDSDFESLSDEDKYDRMIMEIARRAPLRVCGQELVSGSATLGAAIDHVVPAFYKGGKVFFSVSHLTPDYQFALRYGVDRYEQEIIERLKQGGSPRQIRFLESLLNVIAALRVYHRRYLERTKDSKPQIYENLLQVPFGAAQNFHQAVQSVWFLFSFMRLCGNWPGIGRLDVLLGDYLKKDLAAGVLTRKRAREILASFFIKGTEWILKDTPLSSGDAQHYQNVVLAGTDLQGREAANEVTFLVLDIVEELGISDFPITVRLHPKTPARLLQKVARVIRHGGGVVAVYNEQVVLKALTNYGYPAAEAHEFANDGCWEVQIPGRTFFIYTPFDSLALLQKVTLRGYERTDFSSFEELYRAYVGDLNAQVAEIYASVSRAFGGPEVRSECKEWAKSTPCSVVSLFERGCIEKARSYYEGGPIYNVYSPHIGGIADTVNALYAIKKLVFDEKKVSFAELAKILQTNWQGKEVLRNYAKSLHYYGTDNDEADEIYASLLHEFALACKQWDGRGNCFFVPGVSTFGREIGWAPNRLAAPEGTFAGAVLAGNASPSPGTDSEGATAVIKSYCKANLSEMVTGTALDLRISPQALSGESGLAALMALLRGFVALGGYFLQIDTVSSETLRQAQQHPQEYKTLSVRVSGWNARFVTLTREWQDMIIGRTEQNV